MRITRLGPEDYTRSPWKNGGGTTIDIAEERLPGSLPGSWEELVWRLGRTTISTPAPFSDLGGFDRLQVVVAGSGLVLDTPGGEIDLRTPFVPARYRGEAPIASRLENGPVEVVNLVADRELADIALEVLGPDAGAALPAATCVIYAPGGPAVLLIGGERFTLAADHALRFDDAASKISCEEGLVLAASITLKASLTTSR